MPTISTIFVLLKLSMEKIQKILLIDDSIAVNNRNEAMLNEVGFFKEIVKYSDPKKALSSIKQNPPNLILLDVNMPGMNGFNFLDEYIQLESIVNSKYKPLIIIVSSLVFSENFYRSNYYKKHGVLGYICKPIDKDDIQDLLEEHFAIESHE